MKHRKHIPFQRKRSGLDDILNRAFLDNGIATIPCNVSGLDDVISHYSVPGCETLNPEFVEYITSTVEAIPANYPVVLELVGHVFTAKEKDIITRTIKADFAFDLGIVEEKNRFQRKTFLITLLGFIVSCLFFTLTRFFSDILAEMVFVFFWFFADTLVGYITFGGYDLYRAHKLAGRLACIEVNFAAVFDPSDYTEAEAEQVFNNLDI